MSANGQGAHGGGAERSFVAPIPPDAPKPPQAHPHLGRPLLSWTYSDTARAPLFHVHRFVAKDGGKEIRPQTLWCNEKGLRWRWAAPPQPRPLYGLDRLAARPEAPVIVCEGEKATVAAGRLFPGYVAVTSAGGARAAKMADWTPLAGRSVVVWPDNDEPGRTYALEVAEILAAIGCEVAVIDAAALATIDAPERCAARQAHGWDADDAVEEWSDLAALRKAALALAKPFKPALGPSQVSAEHASPSRAHALARQSAAAELGLRLSLLDDLIKARGNVQADGNSLPGRAITFPVIEPWPDPVDGDALLSALVKAVRKYVILKGPQTLAVALWAIFTHGLDAFGFSPRLLIRSQHKRCGKTTLMSVLERLVAKPVSLSGVTPAALLRMIEAHCPTVQIDELDALMKADKEMAEALRGLLNSGFERQGARFVKSVPAPEGGYVERAFSTWAAIAAAGIGKIWDTVRDRSIEISLERKLKTQKVDRLRRRDGADLDELARKMARFAHDNQETLVAARPEMPEGLNDRASDAWEPLVAIADLAGGRWPQEARAAALVLTGEAEADEEETNTMLLSDIRDIFAAAVREATPQRAAKVALSSGQLVERDDRPWAEWRNGKPITKNQLSARLRETYRIVSRSVEVVECDAAVDRKGYRLEQFKDAFSRYLP